MRTIQERIESGEYAPGDMLPSETQLVRELGVGRTTVVRALQTLAMRATVHDLAGSVLLVMSLALPGSLHELEDAHKVS